MENLWQSGIFKLTDRAGYALENGTITDVQFVFDDDDGEKILCAHKVLLAFASPVFMKMFFGDLAENTDRPIKIEGMYSRAFKIMLEYIYTDFVRLESWENALLVYDAAKKYMLDALKDHCVNFIVEKMETVNALAALKFAKLHDENQIKDKALQMIREHTSAVIEFPDFINIDLADMLTILHQDNLQATELELFNALESLAAANNVCESENKENKTTGAIDKNPSTLLSQFREAVKKIKFLDMTAEQFSSGPAFSKLLFPDESMALLACLVKPSNIITRYPKDFTQKCSKKRVRFEITIDGLNVGDIIIELRPNRDVDLAEKFLEICAGKKQCGFKGGYFENIKHDSKFYRAVAVDFSTGSVVYELVYRKDNSVKQCDAGTVVLCGDSGGKGYLGQIAFLCSEMNISAQRIIGRVVDGMDIISKFKSLASASGEPTKKIRIAKSEVM